MYYIIYSGEDNFIVLDCVKGNSNEAWEKANKIAEKYLNEDVHYDILGGFSNSGDLYKAVEDYSNAENLMDNSSKIYNFLTGKSINIYL